MTDYYIEDFPEEAIAECSTGKADEAVDYWVDKLAFQPDHEATRKYLGEFGAWDAEELADDEANRRRLFWSMMCDFSEWDGLDCQESACGSNVVCIY